MRKIQTRLAATSCFLLLKVYDLACHAKNSHAFERVRKGLERHIDKIKQRYESLPRARGLPNLSQRFRVVNTDDIRKARAQDVRMVAGVELPSRGRVSVTTRSSNAETMVFICHSGIISEIPREELVPVAG